MYIEDLIIKQHTVTRLVRKITYTGRAEEVPDEKPSHDPSSHGSPSQTILKNHLYYLAVYRFHLPL